ncbi:uncharacterized protein METZ01_LOCUS83979, partial [marine metagenome]
KEVAGGSGFPLHKLANGLRHLAKQITWMPRKFLEKKSRHSCKQNTHRTEIYLIPGQQPYFPKLRVSGIRYLHRLVPTNPNGAQN